MQRHSFLFFGFLLCCGAHAQTKVITLYFDVDQKQPQSYVSLDSALAQIRSAGSIEIKGFADFLGSPEYNQKLSADRARAIQAHLVTKKIEISKISICKGYGEEASRDNGSAEGEQTQRKVEVYFIFDAKSSESKNPAPADQKKNASAIASLGKGESIAVEGLNFIPGRHTLVPEAAPVLDELLNTMREHPGLIIEIQGHICCINDSPDGFDYDTHDWNLSTNRAKVIYEHLVANGIESRRMTYKGFGHKKPKINPEKTADDEQANRRVEIRIVEK